MKKTIRKILVELDVRKQAEELEVPVWQAPSCLFVLMGIIIIAAMTGVYFISQRYDSPEILILSESAVVVILFSVGNVIIRGVEEVAKTSKMRSEFVSIASHQLKTPLAEISWQVDLLLSHYQKGLSEKQKEVLGGISRSNNKMARLVNDLLDVARIEQGKLSLAKEKVNVLDLVDRVVDDNKILAQASNVEVTIDKPDRLPEVYADRRRIKVVLDNLLSNAIKYIIKKGKVQVSVSLKDGKIAVCVEDNGIGIPRSEQNLVFEKFFRSANISRYQVAGTGLGLYIAKNIIKQSGGDIWFKSAENKGSIFCFSLPVTTNRPSGNS